MKKTIFIAFICTGLITNIQAQTKVIAFKSHGGHSADFTAAFFASDEDLENDNLGAYYIPKKELEKKKQKPRLDSVVFVSPTTAVLITSQYCLDPFYEESSKWKPGKETVTKHPLFSKNHSLDSIKNVLKTTYSFYNDIDETVFVGYDNGEGLKGKPGIGNQKSENPGTDTVRAEIAAATNCKCKEHEVPSVKKEKRDGKKALLLVLGITIASFVGGLFMLNKSE